MNISIKIIVLLIVFVASSVSAHPAPSIYFNESEVDIGVGESIIVELRINSSESSMGAETQMWYNESCVRIHNINYSDSPWQPMVEPGWSYQSGHIKMATVNFAGVPSGDHLFALVEIESLQNCTSVLHLTNPQPANLITYDTTIRGRTMDNKTIIALVAFSVMVTGAMADTVPYTVTVYEGQNTTLSINMADFGNMMRGDTGEINRSLTFVNDGDMNATVDAMMTSSVGTTYGFVGGTNVIPGNEFSMGSDGNEVPLMADGTSVYISTVSPGTTVEYDAILHVPATTVTGQYTGNVQVTYG